MARTDFSQKHVRLNYRKCPHITCSQSRRELLHELARRALQYTFNYTECPTQLGTQQLAFDCNAHFSVVRTLLLQHAVVMSTLSRTSPVNGLCLRDSWLILIWWQHFSNSFILYSVIILFVNPRTFKQLPVTEELKR